MLFNEWFLFFWVVYSILTAKWFWQNCFICFIPKRNILIIIENVKRNFLELRKKNLNDFFKKIEK